MQHTQETDENKVAKAVQGEATKYGCKGHNILMAITVNWILREENTKVDK